MLYSYLGGGSSAVTIDIVKPDRVLLGVPFTIKVGVGNSGRSAFANASVSLGLPDGAVFVGEGREKTVKTKDLGRIGSGSVLEEAFTVMLTGGAQSVKPFTASVSYSPESVGSRFEKTQDFDIVADTSGLVLDMTAPEAAVGGEDFTLGLSVKNVSDIDFHDLTLTLVYPAGFEFKQSSLAPDNGNSVWRLGDLRRGSETKLDIRGDLIGAAGSSYDIKAGLDAGFLGEHYPVSEKTASIGIAESPLTVTLAVNDSPDYVAGADDALTYTVNYANGGNDSLRNAIVKVQLAGPMYNFSTLTANGAVSPAGNAVTWSSATTPDLAVIPPHGSGMLTFAVRTVPAYPIRRLSDRNFLLKADARVDADGAPKGVQATHVSGIAHLETKVKGALALDTRVYFRDADSGILNNGPIPPRVGAPTDYTVHWALKNFSTDASGITVRAPLAANVRMTGTVKGVAPESLAYDGNTQQVVWSIDRVSATTGIVGAPLEAVFQIEATPSPNFLHNYMPLIGEATVTGKDEFTGGDLRATDGAITTSLPDDASIGSQGGLVVQ